METVESLTRARDRATGEFAVLEGQIAHARLAGDDKALGKLRRRRDIALRDADEANDALVLALEAEDEGLAAAEAEGRQQREQRAAEVRDQRLDAAIAVDAALSELETATVRYQTLGRQLGRLTKSGSAIVRKESQNMRWAIWMNAERAARLLCVPFANGGRRRTLAELEAGGRSNDL